MKHLQDKWQVVDSSSGDFGPAFVSSDSLGTKFSYKGDSFVLWKAGEKLLIDRLLRKHFPFIGKILSGVLRLAH